MAKKLKNIPELISYETSAEPKAIADGVPVFCAHDEVVSILELKPNPKNPNQHSDDQIKLLSSVIRSTGWRGPITVSKRSGYIVRGHGRLMAAQLAGLSDVPVDYQDYSSEAEEMADLVADNRIAELSDTDNKLLLEVFSDINAGDIPFILSGYTEDEYEQMMASITNESLEIIEDIAPEPPPNPFTQLGDIWYLGNHVLVCGDSTQENVYKTLLGNTKANLIITDPPYNVDYTGGTEEHLKIQGDRQGNAEFKAFLLAAFTNMRKNAKLGASIYVFHADTEGINFRTAFVESGFSLKQCLIWVKNTFVFGRHSYHWRHGAIRF